MSNFTAIVAPLKEFIDTCGRGELEAILWQVVASFDEAEADRLQEKFEDGMGDERVKAMAVKFVNDLDDIIYEVERSRYC